MSEKQPLFQGGPTAPPPAYQQPSQPLPVYAGPYTPPPQSGVGQTSRTTVYVQPTQQTTVLVANKPPNYMVLSIITTFVFCWIFGLIALYMGAQVNSAWLRGSHDEAHRCSRQAKLWNIIGMVVGVVLYAFIIVATVAGNVVSATSCYGC